MVDRGLLDALAEELRELEADLAGELARIRDPGAAPGDLSGALERYASYARRLAQAAEMLELPALHRAATFVVDNTLALAGLSPGARTTEGLLALFDGWIPALGALLSEPQDEACRQALLALLADPHWPIPLDDREALAAELADELGAAALGGAAAGPARPTEARPEDVAVSFAEDISPQLVDAFLHETPQHVGRFSAAIQRLAAMPAGTVDAAELSTAQRLAHTIKGSANITGVPGMANMTHHAEDILEHLAERGQAPDERLADLLMRAADCLEVMVESLTGAGPPPDDAQPVLQELLDWANRMDRGEPIEELAVDALPPMGPSGEDEAAGVQGGREPGVEPDGVGAPPPDAGEPVHRPWPGSEPAAAGPIASEPGAAAAAAEPPVPAAAEAPAPVPAEAPAPVLAEAGASPEAAQASLRVAMGRVDALLRLAGEMTTSIVQLAGLQRRLVAQAAQLREQNLLVQQRLSTLQDLVELRGVPSVRREFAGMAGHPGRTEFDPLELDEYNELHSATNALAETLTDVREMSDGLRADLATFDDMVVQQQQVSSELNDEVLSARMVPVASAVPRLQRAVRQACRMTGKRVRLVVAGEDMQVDNFILGAVVDPLLHLVRNAVDHGIEERELRLARAKPEEGRVVLRFSREGETLLVECEDDGAGLDFEGIRRTAVDKRLVDAATELDDAQLSRFTLLPGFTTRADATQLSGRGIGLDVVHKTITDLRGDINISSVEGQGTRIEIRVPLTLISMHVLLVRAGGRVFGVPSSTLEQLLYSDAGSLEEVGGRQAFSYQGDDYTVTSLDSLLGQAGAEPGHLNGSPKPLLLIRADTSSAAVAIDTVVDGRYLVVKRLGTFAPKARGVVGASILADGSVAPVLDIRELLRTPVTVQLDPGRVQALGEAALADVPSVLIVDDSLSARRTLSQVVSEAGFEARTAVDGLEAIEVIEQRMPDAVLLDMEMPRMNGLELASHLRADDGTRSLPLLMVTSRSTIKHREQARAAGVDVFITKPYEDMELTQELRRLIAAR